MAEKLSGFPRKWARILEIDNDESDDNNFLDKVQQSSKEDLDDMIVTCNENIAEFKKDEDADLDLQNLKEQVKDASAIYRDGVKINNARAMYCVYIKKSL